MFRKIQMPSGYPQWYSKLLPDVHRVVKYTWSTDQNQGITVAFRRDKNLCDTLVHSKTNAAFTSANITSKTDCANCGLLSRDAVNDTSNQLTFKPAQDFTCRIRNVVYGILCTGCQATVYVGETERELQERMTEHLRDVRLQKDKLKQ